MHRRKSEPRPFVALRREERLEDTRRGCSVHARPFVNDPQQRKPGRTAVVSGIEARGRDLDPEHPAVRHCVPRIDCEIRNHALELTAVRLHDYRLLREHRHELDVVADHALQESVGRADNVIEIEHFRVEHLAASKRKQLLGQVGCTCRSHQHRCDVFRYAVLITLEPAERKLAVAADREEQVVEIVGHAAGQLPERLELLRLAQLTLEVRVLELDGLALGFVEHDADHPRRRPVCIPEHSASAEHRPDLAGRPHDTTKRLVVRLARCENAVDIGD